jgi:plastocyanin
MTRFTTRAAGLLAVPLLLFGCSSGGGGKSTGTVTTTGAADAQTATVDAGQDLKFRPSTVLARVGTVTLTVANTGQVPHDLVFDDKALGKTGTVDGKTSEPLKVTFSKAGTFTFTCTFHSGMSGKVVVS